MSFRRGIFVGLQPSITYTKSNYYYELGTYFECVMLGMSLIPSTKEENDHTQRHSGT